MTKPGTVTRPSFSVSQAADLCQVSRKTITRRLSALQDHGAIKDALGQWSIPVVALQAVGLRPGRPTDVGQQDSDLGTADLSPTVVPAEVLAELADYRRRAEVAEAVLIERERLVEALQLALRQLESRPIDHIQTESPEKPDLQGEESAEVSSADLVRSAAAVVPAAAPAPGSRQVGRFRRWFKGA